VSSKTSLSHGGWCGRPWPDLARAACSDLCGAGDDSTTDDIQLLTDIRFVFERQNAEFIRSVELVAKLVQCEDSPWRDDKLTAHGVARMLKAFGVKPRYGSDGRSLRGFRTYPDRN
jgi:hypothetical protein